MLKILLKIWLVSIVLGVVVQLGLWVFRAGSDVNARKLDMSHLNLTLSGSSWEQSCSRYNSQSPCLKHVINRGTFTLPETIDEGEPGEQYPYSLFIGANGNGVPSISINFEPPKLHEMPYLPAFANKLTGSLELPDSTRFDFKQCVAKDANNKFPKGAIQCYYNFETEKLYTNLATGPSTPIVAKVTIPRELSNYKVAEYGLVFTIPALTKESNQQLTVMTAKREVRIRAQREAKTQAELAAKAEKDTQETQKPEAEIARKQEAERATQTRYSAVSGPGFEETIRWLHDNLNKRPRWICQDKTKYGFDEGKKFYCYSADFALNAECKVTITSTRTYNYISSRSAGYDKYEKTSTVYEFPNFGYTEIQIRSWDYVYGELIYDIGYKGTLKRKTYPAASSQFRSTNMTVSSRSGGVIKQTDDILEYDWDDISSDPSVYNWQRRSKHNSLHQEVSSAKNIYLGFNPDMGKRIQTALNKYSEHCRVSFPEKTSLF